MDLTRRSVVAGVAASLAGCSSRETGRATTTPERSTPTSTGRPTETRTSDGGWERPLEHTTVSEMDLEGAADGVLASLAVSTRGLVAGGGIDGDAALVAIDPGLDVRWVQRYADADPWMGRYTATTAAPDGGYTLSAVPPDDDGARIVVKTDRRGRPEARGRIDVGASAAEASFAQLAGGGYVAGWTERGTHRAAGYVLGMDDPGGEVRWRREYLDEQFALERIVPTTDGGCLLTGDGLRIGRWMARLEADGTEAWRYVFDEHSGVHARRASDGFVTASETYDRGTATGFRIRTFAPDRSERWRRTYDAPASRVEALAVVDGGFLVVSAAERGFWTTTVASDGAALDRTRYHVADREDVVVEAARQVDGRYVVAGRFRSEPPGTNGWLAAVEPDER